jgi:hypothetical protein
MSLDIESTATLNGESVDLTIEEDTTGDGTVDNSETIPMEDGTNTYTFSSIDGDAGNYIRGVIDLSTTDVTTSPIFTAFSGTGNASGGGAVTVKYQTDGVWKTLPLRVNIDESWERPVALNTAGKGGF